MPSKHELAVHEIEDQMSERVIGVLAEVHSLPREYYVSPDVFDREVEAILRPSWMLAGHVSELENPRDFITFNWRNESAIILRTDSGDLVGHNNFCRHRGYRLFEEKAGKGHSTIVCGYHGWCYEQTGELRRATRLGDEQLDRHAWGLKPVAVEVWNGLVFVSFAPEPPEPLTVQLANLDLSRYGLDRAKVAHRQYREFGANWKVVADNINECYHCTINHPELSRALDVHTIDNAGEILVAPSGYLANEMPLRGISFTRSGELASRVTLGHPNASSDSSAMLGMFPGMLMFCYPDYVSILSIVPLAHDRTALENLFLVSSSAVEGEDYDLAEIIEMQVLATDQDGPLIERAWAGLQSPSFEFGPYHPGYEPTLKEFTDWYRSRMGV